MFVCSFCRGEFNHCVLLIHHYRLSHPSLDVFHCEVENCRRTFSSLKNFGKHLKVKHDDNNHVDAIDSDSIKSANYSFRIAESSTNSKITLLSHQKRQRIKEMPKASVNPTSMFGKPVVNKIVGKNIETPKTHRTTLTKSNEEPQISSPRPSKKSVDSDGMGLLFAAKLHNYSDIPRLRVQNIIHDVDALIIGTVEMIKKNVLRAIEKTPVDTNVLKKVEAVFSEFESPLSCLKTEWQCLQRFRECSTYIEPVHYSLGERDEYVNENGVQIIKKVRVTAQFIPMTKVFKKLFELPNIFDETVDYVTSLKTNSTIISNFVQGTLWGEIISEFEQEVVFPLFMYFDDYETNNPLGSHKGIAKCGAVYLSIPCLPPKYQSKLANIFLFILFNTLDRETFRNASVFTRAIKELQFLKDVGITIEHSSGPKKIRFVLSLILGDNLGLHSLFGFVTSFRSTYFCRFCLTEYKKLSTIFEECQCVLRNESNYTENLAINDFTQTGIKEPCIFHKLPNFHVTKNLSVDVMHDVLEGICQYDLGLIFHHYIFQAKLFSLSELNDKIRGFFYGPDWSINKPPEILESHIKNRRLMMTSSEMLFLIRHLGLILGAKIPHGNEYWDIIVQLKRIVEMVLSPNYHAGWENLFGVMISEYLEVLSELFPGCLKPKHHFLIHYPRVMTTVGPLWKICSMRFESKHQEGKMTSRTAISRVNVCRTIAVKHQLRVNYRLLTGNYGIQRYQGITQKVSLNDNADGDSFAHILLQNASKEVSVINRIEFHGRLITKDSVIMRPSEDGPQFYVVNYIIVEEDGYYIVAKQLHDCYFDYHTQAYQIMRLEDYTWQILRLEEQTEVTVTHIVHLSNACNYIIKNWF